MTAKLAAAGWTEIIRTGWADNQPQILFGISADHKTIVRNPSASPTANIILFLRRTK